jgi:hypothetical protein
MINFTCACGNALFFENSHCLQCRREVGYAPELNRMMVLDAESGWKRCSNGIQYGICNWAIPVDAPQEKCRSCQFTRTVADLSNPAYLTAWQKLEAAKRRVLQTILRLGLHPATRAERADGLAFDFLAPASTPVVTGHLDGVITLNINEANDAYRENERLALGEPYRTLIGHFRHEVGHYFWDRFFKGAFNDNPDLVEFRQLFGDERVDYAASLQNHYQGGSNPADPSEFITTYASVHPWEDWAETWAQYLHLTDALETVRTFGWRSEAIPFRFTPLEAKAVFVGGAKPDLSFLKDVNDWARIAPAFNEIAASLGHANLYPFVLSPKIVQKIHFVHRIVHRASKQTKPPEPAMTQAA